MLEYISGCIQPKIIRSGLDSLKRIGVGTDGFSVGYIQKRNKKLVGVIGLGSVGSALSIVMGYYYDVVGYDIKGNYDWNRILDCESVFICVQTPKGIDGRLDCSSVDNVLEKLNNDSYTGIIVIKSTLGAGFMDSVAKKYSDLKLVYSPEFMSEKNALPWTAYPDRIVLSEDKKLMDYVQDLYSWAESAIIIRTDFRSAEIGKLAHNALIALKVTFTNIMEAICESFGANVDDVMKIVYTDRRVANSAHLEPHKGPYGGKCVPKDTDELINAFGDMAKLLQVVDEINSKLTFNVKKSDKNRQME